MKRVQAVVAVVVIVLAGLYTGTPHAAQAPGERAAIEVRAAWDQYLEAFGSGRADLIAARSYLTPSFSLAGTRGTSVSLAPSEIESRFKLAIAALVEQNYARTETKAANICVLNESAAVLSGSFTRYKKDGSVLAELAGTYLFAKTADGWRIAAQIAHEPGRVMACGK